MPLPSIGMTREDFRDLAVLAKLADENDTADEAMDKLADMYEKIRQHGEEDPAAQQGMTPEQATFEEANYLLDNAVLTGGKWSDLRPKLEELYRSVGREDMAEFVNPKVL
jgi:Asp-tRNA(Asn)/Glu-tRNA(Gln) amidotransferase C subunit